MTYTPADNRYNVQPFRRCGQSGLKLPAISLGMWHNFGDATADEENCRRMCYTALDHGVTHFDLANNYGPPPGSAETRTGKIIKDMPRHELVISTKAGFTMWPGPYGDYGSRKYLLQSLDASLKRLDLDHVDIFYHHRPDMDTPLDETMSALETAVQSGKAIYAGISNYNGARTAQAVSTMKEHDWAKLIIHQVNYSMFRRQPEYDLFPVTQASGMGVICFCPLAQGLLTDKYLNGIPKDSRAASATGFLKPDRVTPNLEKIKKLNDIALQRGQSLAQMALAWVLRLPSVTSALIGASKPQQIIENVKALEKATFTEQELKAIDDIVGVH